jgi:hypothetical protein
MAHGKDRMMSNTLAAVRLTTVSLYFWKTCVLLQLCTLGLLVPNTRAGDAKTQREAYAQRWRLDLSGDGKEHAAKLASFGIKLGFLDAKKNFLVVKDLTKRPVETQKEDPRAFFGVVVIWKNDKQESIRKLTNEIELPFSPASILIILPKEREKQLADVEGEYARNKGHTLERIRNTWFDLQLKNGAYEPVVIRQTSRTDTDRQNCR